MSELTDRLTDGSTCEEDEVPLLCVLSLELDETFQVRGLTRLGVTLVVGEELHEVLLLIGGEEVQEPHGVGAQPSEGQNYALMIDSKRKACNI